MITDGESDAQFPVRAWQCTARACACGPYLCCCERGPGGKCSGCKAPLVFARPRPPQFPRAAAPAAGAAA